MQSIFRQPGLGWLSGLLLATLAGCTISIQPWTKNGPPPPLPGQPLDHPASPYPPGILPNSVMRPPPAAPPPNLGAESMVQLFKQLNETEDNRKALQDQTFALKKQLKDREENLRVASYEMEESSKQIKRARDDFRQWQAEMDELRERIRKLEESRASLKPLIEEILLQLDRDKEAYKSKSLQRLAK